MEKFKKFFDDHKKKIAAVGAVGTTGVLAGVGVALVTKSSKFNSAFVDVNLKTGEYWFEVHRKLGRDTFYKINTIISAVERHKEELASAVEENAKSLVA